MISKEGNFFTIEGQMTVAVCSIPPKTSLYSSSLNSMNRKVDIEVKSGCVHQKLLPQRQERPNKGPLFKVRKVNSHMIRSSH